MSAVSYVKRRLRGLTPWRRSTRATASRTHRHRCGDHQRRTAIERYLLAFENGALPEGKCGMCVQKLGATMADLRDRRSRLHASLDGQTAQTPRPEQEPLRPGHARPRRQGKGFVWGHLMWRRRSPIRTLPRCARAWCAVDDLHLDDTRGAGRTSRRSAALAAACRAQTRRDGGADEEAARHAAPASAVSAGVRMRQRPDLRAGRRSCRSAPDLPACGSAPEPMTHLVCQRQTVAYGKSGGRAACSRWQRERGKWGSWSA